MNKVGEESNQRRNYHLEMVDSTIWSGGDLEVGDMMSMNSTIAQSDDFETWESEVAKPLIEKAIINGDHRWWRLSKIYERTENANEGITQLQFHRGNPCDIDYPQRKSNRKIKKEIAKV